MAKFNQLIKKYHETIKLCNTEPTPEILKERERIWEELRRIYHSKNKGGD